MTTADNTPIKPTPPTRREGDFYADGERTRVPPNTRKEFKEFMEKEDLRRIPPRPDRRQTKSKPSTNPEKTEDRDDVEEVADLDEDTIPLDPFGLNAKKRLAKAKRVPLPGEDAGSEFIAEKEDPKQSPLSIYRSLSNKVPPRPFAEETLSSSESDVPVTPRDKTKKEKSSTSRYSQEDQDLGILNPMAYGSMSTVASVGEAKGSVKSDAAANIRELIEKIVDRLYLLERSGRTDTVIEIKNIPMFENANIIISSFDHATKEFNLAFENLTQAAKQLLDANMNALKTNLEEKGYANAIHIITTTTFIEHRPLDQGGQYARGDEEKEQGQQQQQQREQEEET